MDLLDWCHHPEPILKENFMSMFAICPFCERVPPESRELCDMKTCPLDSFSAELPADKEQELRQILKKIKTAENEKKKMLAQWPNPTTPILTEEDVRRIVREELKNYNPNPRFK